MRKLGSSGATDYIYDNGGRLLSECDASGACVKDYLYLGGKIIGGGTSRLQQLLLWLGSDQLHASGHRYHRSRIKKSQKSLLTMWFLFCQIFSFPLKNDSGEEICDE